MLSSLAHARLPFSRYPLVAAASLEEAAAIYGRIAPLRLTQLSSSRGFVWQTNRLALGPLSISADQNSATVQAECEGASEAYLLAIPLAEATAESRVGGIVTPLVRGRSAAFCAPWQDVGVLVRGGYRGLQLSMPRSTLLMAVATLTGSEPRELRFERRLALDSAPVEPFTRLIGHLLKDAESEHPQFAAAGAAEQLAEALLFRLLVGQPHTQSALFSTRVQPAEPRYVRRAAEYLDMHFERAVTMAELTRVTGTSARSLQLGFQRYRGCSPLAFVRTRRLERARVLLLTDDTAQTVSEAARRVGIEHLGRFSLRYRARFGESPARTLARRWRRTTG